MPDPRLLNMLVFLGLLVPDDGDSPVGVAAPDDSVESVIRCTRSNESWSAASVWWSNGSRLLRTVPENRTGSYRVLIFYAFCLLYWIYLLVE